MAPIGEVNVEAGGNVKEHCYNVRGDRGLHCIGKQCHAILIQTIEKAAPDLIGRTEHLLDLAQCQPHIVALLLGQAMVTSHPSLEYTVKGVGHHSGWHSTAQHHTTVPKGILTWPVFERKETNKRQPDVSLRVLKNYE